MQLLESFVKFSPDLVAALTLALILAMIITYNSIEAALKSRTPERRRTLEKMSREFLITAGIIVALFILLILSAIMFIVGTFKSGISFISKVIRRMRNDNAEAERLMDEASRGETLN